MIAAAILAAAPVYGPVEPKPFEYPERFTVQPHQTVEEAQEDVNKMRRCAKRWALVGAVGGGALDIATTQINQRDGYREANPLYGKKASIGEMLVYRGLSGGINYLTITRAARKDPAAACKLAKVSAGVAFLPGLVNIGVRIKF